MNELKRLQDELHDIAQRANREIRIFRSSPDIIAPRAAYAVENLDKITKELNRHLAIIAEHQAAAALHQRDLLGGYND